MKCKLVVKCLSALVSGVFLFNVAMPYGRISADELTDSPDIGVENEVVLAPSSTAQVRSNGTYTSTVDSVPDRWTVGDVIQYSCDAPAGADVTWSVTVSGVISVTDTGLVTALKQGYTILKAEWASNSMSTQVYVGTIPDGTYFIGNKQTGKYMDLEGAGTADGTNIQQWDFHGGIQSQWNITLDQYGYYLIQSAYTGKYVGVEDSSSSTNAKIKQYSFHRTSPGIRWLITPTASGAYKFTCQAAEDTNMVITVPSSGSTANGTDLIQYSYSNNAVYRDEWVIQRQGSASFLAIPEEDGRDRTSSFSSAGQSVSAMGYGDVTMYTEQIAAAVTVNDCLEIIASSDIFYVRTHGAQCSISLSQGIVNTTNVANLPDNALSECKLVLYGACYTGKYRETRSDNLVNQTQAKGVVTVIGFDDTVGCNEMNAWATKFFEFLANGDTVEQACDNADEWIEESRKYALTTVDHSYIAGNKTQKLPYSVGMGNSLGGN